VVLILEVPVELLNQACLPNSKRIEPEAVPDAVAPMFTELFENSLTFRDLLPRMVMFPVLARMSELTQPMEWDPPDVPSIKTSPPAGAWITILTEVEVLYPKIPIAPAAELLFSLMISIARPVDLLEVKLIGAMF
jgi:hypothetical protein